MITHPAVLRPLIDYAFKAVGPQGRIWLMDAPLYDADFAAIARRCQLAEFEACLRGRGVPLNMADLRSFLIALIGALAPEQEYERCQARFHPPRTTL